jgi:hypothetical protein
MGRLALALPLIEADEVIMSGVPARESRPEADRPPKLEPVADVGPRPSQFERMVFFSDAVFAISITLLAIDLRLPETAARLTGSDLNQALVDLAPKVFTYAMSFAVIGLYWPSVVILYALVMSGAGIAGTWSWLYANRAGLAPHGRSDRWVRAVAMRGLIMPAVFLGSLPLLLVSTALVNLAWLLVFPAQAWVLRLMRTEEDGGQP